MSFWYGNAVIHFRTFMTEAEISKAVQTDMGDDWETRQPGDTQLITITVAYLKIRKTAYKNGSETEKNKPNKRRTLKRNGTCRRGF
jgi:hypothetical protein